MAEDAIRGRRRRRTIVVAVFLILAAFATSRLLDEPSATPVAEQRRIAAISLTDFDGAQFTLGEYAGTPVVVNFWASWCPSCVAEMPDFEKVHQEAVGEIAFVGINQTDAREPAEDLARQTGVTYRLATDPQGEIFRAVGAPGMPTTVFIDAAGNIVDVVVGQLSKDKLIEYIERSFPDHDVG